MLGRLDTAAARALHAGRLAVPERAQAAAAMQHAAALARPGHNQSGRGRDVRVFGIKLVESFDSPLDLPEPARNALSELLRNPTFCAQVARDTGEAEGTEVEFAELLFQPVPWSPTTTKGMPASMEKYHDDPAYVTINVPPNFLFQAKIFKPSRLCAIYRKK